jgi:hypothetical protein
MSRAWSDEQISAFLDGELDPADFEAMLHDVETDPAVAARVRRMSEATKAFVKASLSIDDEPMSEGLTRALAAPPTAKVIPFRGRSFAATVMEHRAIAAGLVCAFAAWSMFSVIAPGRDGLSDTGGMVVATSPLHRALETGATGDLVTISASETMTPRLTFARADGDFCRQFDVTSRDGVMSAIACRDGGVWRTEVAVYGQALPGGEYVTASGEKAAPLEAFIDRSIAGDPLDAAAEKAAIASSWASTPR